ncbi:MAG: mevalonate kinase [Anaerolineae bacterium]|nr:mevalonate kinase [Chloroflexota bacterium]MBP6297708.1 mevalonate kinase [Anaerolineae bacterium]
MSSPAESINTSAPAKVILFGEHAVVYGQPALAVPVSSLRVSVTVESSDHVVFATGEWTREFPAEVLTSKLTDPLLKMAQATAEHLNIALPFARYTISSDIPVASGLGSGAAVSAALGRAIAAAGGKTIADDELNELVYEIEAIHHGTPSGIDNTVIVFERPVYFLRGHPPQTFEVGRPVHLLIADTGRSALTKESVGDVRKLVEVRPEFAVPRIEQIGRIVNDAREALSSGSIERLGQLMGENQVLLADLTVSSPELDILIQAALHAGAIGAKLSGGGRGGNMIAIVTSETESPVRAALLSSGAVRVISTVIQ